MKNPIPASNKFIYWTTVVIAGVIACFNFVLACYLFFPLLILFYTGTWLMKKNHISSIENFMIAGYRLLFFVSMT